MSFSKTKNLWSILKIAGKLKRKLAVLLSIKSRLPGGLHWDNADRGTLVIAWGPIGLTWVAGESEQSPDHLIRKIKNETNAGEKPTFFIYSSREWNLK